MKVSQFAAILEAADSLSGAADPSERLGQLEQWSKLLADRGQQTVASFVKQLERTIAAPPSGGTNRAEHSVAEARKLIDAIGHLLATAGAKGPAKDCKLVSNVLRHFDCNAFSQFVVDATTLQKSTRSRKAPKPKSNRADQTQSIDAHISQLRQAGTSRDVFDRAVLQLRADKRLKLADHAEIARQYVGSVTKYKSITAAHSDIQDAFIRQARFENKLR
jgi:hypothetical protein